MIRTYKVAIFFYTCFALVGLNPALHAETQGIPPSETEVYDLAACIAMSMHNDPELKYAMDNYEIGLLQEDEAKRAFWLPTISVETQYGPKLNFFGNPITDDNIYRSGVKVEKPLFKGGELHAGVELGQTASIVAHHDYNAQMVELATKTADRYYRLLADQQNDDAYAALYDQSLRSHALLREKHQVGEITRVDLLEAETRFVEVEYEAIKAKTARKTAMRALNETMGRDSNMTIRLKNEWPKETIPDNTDALIDQAISRRPDYLYQKELAEYRRLRVDLSKSKRLPAVNLVGGYSWEGYDFPGEDDELSISLQFSFSLHDATLKSSVARYQLYENEFRFLGNDTDFDVQSVKLSLFDGSSNAVDEKSALAEYRLAKNNLQKMRRKLVTEVQDAFNRVEEATAFLSTAQKAIDLSEEKLKIIETKFALKETTEIELMDAERDRVHALARYHQAEYEKALATIKLYQAIGAKISTQGNPEGNNRQ